MISPAAILVRIIRQYQKTLSPDHGWFRHRHPLGYCRFYPSCSEYAAQAVSAHGVFRGTVMGFLRIIKCNPWSKGGLDPVR